jgi:murein DD-endopeptidase MepM/ murein hydrolase activator NlpD
MAGVQAPAEQREYVLTGNNSLRKIYCAASSSFSANHRGHKILDSTTGTAWVSDRSAEGQWVQVDFVTKRLMSRISVYPGKKDNYWTAHYLILQFKENDEWFDFARVPLEETRRYFGLSRISATKKSYKEKADIELGGIDASTFRLFFPPDAMIDGHAAVAEIEIYTGSNRLKCFDERLKGLCLPVRNAYLPAGDDGYPNAPRRYRGGTHAGLDIFFRYNEDSYTPVPVDFSTAIYAMDKGKILRADTDYRPLTPEEWRKHSENSRNHPRTFVKQSFGGRQVWIDHENGIVTTYNHLSGIEHGIRPGSIVKKGQRIGFAGNSGLLGEAEGKSYGSHLHLEIWIDGTYLGYGMEIGDVKKYFSWIFSVSQ